MKKESLEAVLSRSLGEIKRRNTVSGKRRGPYKKIERPQRSRDELLLFLRKNNIKGRKHLDKFRQDGGPSAYDYWKEFGSWSKAISTAWGDFVDIDRHYIVRTVVEFNLWTFKAYCRMRKLNPDVIPSIYVMRKEFGSWSVLKSIAQAFSVKETLRTYMELRRKLRRRPTNEDCQRARIDLTKVIEIYGDKRKFDRFVDSLEKVK